MPDHSAKIAALEDALGSGELTVESDGERITYRSTADLREALAYFKSAQSAAAPADPFQPAFGFSAAAFSRE